MFFAFVFTMCVCVYPCCPHSAIFKVLLSAGALPTTPESAEALPKVLDELFDSFDADHSDSVDMAELASGLSLLCGGTRDDKIRAAFELYGKCHVGDCTYVCPFQR